MLHSIKNILIILLQIEDLLSSICEVFEIPEIKKERE